MWQDEQSLPPHLRMHLQVVQRGKKVIAGGDDLKKLQQDLCSGRGRVKAALMESPEVKKARAKWETRGITVETYPDLPKTVTAGRGTSAVKLFPALAFRKGRIDAVLAGSRNEAARLTRTGMRWLIVSALEPQFRYVKKMCRNMRLPVKNSALLFTESRQRLSENTWQMICAELTGTWDTPPQRHELEKFIQELRPVMAAHAQEITELVVSAAECAARARQAVTELRHGRFAGPTTVAIADQLESDLRSLFPEDFPAGCRPEELEQYPRYLRAVETMARRAGAAPAKQEAKIKQLSPAHGIMHAAERYIRSGEQEHAEDMERLRVMCRELMVSVYAPELGAMKGVSMKRIMRMWEEVRHAAEDTQTHMD
jgi:hypothetical protein